MSGELSKPELQTPLATDQRVFTGASLFICVSFYEVAVNQNIHSLEYNNNAKVLCVKYNKSGRMFSNIVV